MVTALPRAWEPWSWIYQGLPVYSSLNKLRSSAKGEPRGSGANLYHCSAMYPVVFPAWWCEISPGWSGVQKWILPSRGESWTSPFRFLTSIIMPWFSQEAPSLHLVMIQQKKAMSPTQPSREHFIFKPLSFGTVGDIGGGGVGISFSTSSHAFFSSWSFLLHQVVVTASLQQPYLTAGGICLCLNLCIFRWLYFSDYKANDEIKQNSIKAAGLEVH